MASRVILGLTLVVGVLAGGLGMATLARPPAPIGETEIRRIVGDYLNDPAVVGRIEARLVENSRVAAAQAAQERLKPHHAAIYDDPDNVVLGAADGDVTLVELFDYNCGYCRAALPTLTALLQSDDKLRVILKEFPILSQGSLDAAKVALLVADQKLDYLQFHKKLLAARGQVTEETALDIAQELGADRAALTSKMAGAALADAIQRTYKLAEALEISGTPTYILGDEIISGAVAVDVLREKIANMRACGATTCAKG